MENNINNQIKELNQLGGKLLMLEMIILKNFIDKTKNNIIRQYLEEMLHNHIYISFVSLTYDDNYEGLKKLILA